MLLVEFLINIKFLVKSILIRFNLQKKQWYEISNISNPKFNSGIVATSDKFLYLIGGKNHKN